MIAVPFRFTFILLALFGAASAATAHGGHGHGPSLESASSNTVGVSDASGEGFWPFGRKPNETVVEVETLEAALEEEQKKALAAAAPAPRVAELNQQRTILAARKEIAAKRADRDAARGFGENAEAGRLERDIHAIKQKLELLSKTSPVPGRTLERASVP